MNTASLFEKHLDVTPLRGRRRGLVRCRFHPDRRASLSIDLDRGVFNCFGCGVRGGSRRFGELVGESPATARTGQSSAPSLSVHALALRLAPTQPWADPLARELYRLADYIRSCYQHADALRRTGTATGPTVAVWDALADAADYERAALWAEAVLDEALT